jgi:hypothetical protein
MATFPTETLDALEGGSRMAWFPIEHDHWVVDGIIGVLGREQAIRLWRASVPDIVDKPLLRTFVSGMLRVLGDDPARIIGLFPKAWPLIYEGFSELTLNTESSTQVTVVFDQLAPQLRTYPNYFVSWTGIVQGLLELAHVEAEVELTIAPDVRSARARCSW